MLSPETKRQRAWLRTCKKNVFFSTSENGYEIDNPESVGPVGFIILHGEVEPLVITERVGVIVYKQNVLIRLLVFVGAMKIAALEPRIYFKGVGPGRQRIEILVIVPVLEGGDLLFGLELRVSDVL